MKVIYTRENIRYIKRVMSDSAISFKNTFLAGAVLQLQAMTFHRQAKMAFKNKSPGFEFKMAE